MIPDAILQDEDLSLREMLLYGYIQRLTKNKYGYCFASNQALGKLIYLSKNRVSVCISNLIEKGYVEAKNIDIDGTEMRGLRVLPKTVRGITENDNPPLPKTVTPPLPKTVTIDIQDIQKDLSKDKSIASKCSVVDLVEAYKSDKILPQMLDDVQLVQQWAEYKQAKKDRAYKTVGGFLQQLKVCITTVRHNEVRGDTKLRFRFAMNQAMEKTWKSMYWNDNTEAEYQQRKKLYLLEQKQNE